MNRIKGGKNEGNRRSRLALLVLTGLLLSGTAAFSQSTVDHEDLLNSHQSIMMFIDPGTGEILFANEAAREFYGYPDLTAMSIIEINTLPEGEVEKELALAAAGDRNYFNFQHLLADGSVKSVEIRAYPFDYQGEVCLFSIVNDRTRLVQLARHNKTLYAAIHFLLLLSLAILSVMLYRTRRLNRQIRRSQERTENIIQATNAGTWEWDYASGDLLVNDRWAGMLGYTREELSPITMTTFRSLLHEEDRAGDEVRLVDDGQHEAVFRMRHKEGRWVWVQSTGKVTVWAGEKTPRTLMGTHIDISRKKALEAHHRFTENRYRTITSVSNIGVWEYDQQSGSLWCSEEYFQLLGHARDRFISGDTCDAMRVWRPLVHPDDLDPAVARLMAYVDDSSAGSYENRFRMLGADGDYRWILSRARTLKDESGAPTDITVGIHIDITDIKHYEEQLEFTSYHDHLTGLFNRRYFFDYLKKIDRPWNLPIGLTMIDLNGLKLINDAFGTAAGDGVLDLLGMTLKWVARDYGILARIGGDEFIIVTLKQGERELDLLKEGILRMAGKLYHENVQISVAVGTGLKEKESQDLGEVFKTAERQMFKRKIIDGRSVVNHSIRGILETLTNKYSEEKQHSEEVGRLCGLMGRALELTVEDIHELELAGMLHDIGKVTIPDSVLDKPGKLTDEEYQIMKDHTRAGYQILRAADEFTDLAVYALRHHEKYDGTGYPGGLAGEEIPYFARIIAIADAYEAMMSDRTYRKALTFQEAVGELEAFAGTQFDPRLVRVFIDEVLPLEREEKSTD